MNPMILYLRVSAIISLHNIKIIRKPQKEKDKWAEVFFIGYISIWYQNTQFCSLSVLFSNSMHSFYKKYWLCSM